MIRTHIKNDKIIITIDTEKLNLFATADLKKFLFKIPIESNEKVVLDMGNVIDLDSSGLGLIITFWQHLKNNNSQMVMANGTEKVKMVLKMTNVGKMIPYYETVDEAFSN